MSQRRGNSNIDQDDSVEMDEEKEFQEEDEENEAKSDDQDDKNTDIPPEQLQRIENIGHRPSAVEVDPNSYGDHFG